MVPAESSSPQAGFGSLTSEYRFMVQGSRLSLTTIGNGAGFDLPALGLVGGALVLRRWRGGLAGGWAVVRIVISDETNPISGTKVGECLGWRCRENGQFLEADQG